MVNKDALFQTFMKLESYDKINIIADIIKFSNLFELEFYSSIIESILSYQKISFEGLKDELNHDNNILFLKDTECIDSNTRAKLISTLSLLKVSNITGAAHIFEFLRKNYHKFKELAQTNPTTHEEILLIYQLANNHPAFSFNHCQEIYDYLKEIKAIPVINDHSEIQKNNEFIIDLNVTSIDKNDQQQYIFVIKVTWNLFECCIMRSLEDVYKFYSRVYEMFTLEAKNGEICPLYLSFIPDNLEFSKSLMVKFLSDFLKSPQHILRCDYVRQFFKPRMSDKCICDCNSCQTIFEKLYWTESQSFEHISNCSSSNNQSDIEDFSQTFGNKSKLSSSSHFNFSLASLYPFNNLPLAVSINSDVNESSLNQMKRVLHSSGSSPINTPSDESDLSTKNGSSKYHCNEIYHQLSNGIKNNDLINMKDFRTETWLCQTTNSGIDINKMTSQSEVSTENPDQELLDNYNRDESSHNLQDNIKEFYLYQIGNLRDWLTQFDLQNNYSLIKHLSFGEFHSLSEDRLSSLGFIKESSQKLISLINDLRLTDVQVIDKEVIHLTIRNHFNSIDSSKSFFGSCGDISSQRSDIVCEFPGSKTLDINGFTMVPQFCYPSFMSMSNLILLPPTIVPGSQMFSLAPDKQSNQLNHTILKSW